jgi:hypothetical protein
MTIRRECAEKRTSFTNYFGNTFLNDPGVGGPPGKSTFLTGGTHFLVNEIKVFEIKD